MRRLFWLGVGITVGGLVVRKLTRAAESYTPRGLATSARASVTDLADAAREFVEDFREAMAEREEDLLAALDVSQGSDAPDAPPDR